MGDFEGNWAQFLLFKNTLLTDDIMQSHMLIEALSQYVTGFAKRDLPHTSNLPTLTIRTVGLVKAINLKFGQQEVTT